MAPDEVHSYLAYGLGIRSALPLPELLVRPAVPDVVLRVGRIDVVPPRADDASVRCWATPHEFGFSSERIGKGVVRGGCEIIVDPVPGVEARRLRLFILSWLLSAVLLQRGRLLLHASAVAMNGRVVAFVGQRGAGKSTLASALYERGSALVADDLLAIDTTPPIPAVDPGFPQCKLLPESIASIGQPPETLPPLHSASAKRVLHAVRGFREHRLPLDRIYVLADGDREWIEPLAPTAAVWELVRHTYVRALIEVSRAWAAHLHQCADLARRVAVCRLQRRRSLEHLADTVRLIEAELARDTPAGTKVEGEPMPAYQ
jgi:hypothetical protein